MTLILVTLRSRAGSCTVRAGRPAHRAMHAGPAVPRRRLRIALLPVARVASVAQVPGGLAQVTRGLYNRAHGGHSSKSEPCAGAAAPGDGRGAAALAPRADVRGAARLAGGARD